MLYVYVMTKRNEIERLFRSNYAAMLTLASRLMHDRDMARDIVHDVFAALLADSPETVTAAYLLKGVRYACLTHMRNMSLRNRLNQFYAIDINEIADDDEWPDDEDVIRLNSIIDSHLPVQCRRVVRLRFTSRLTYKEIAEELGITEVAVYKHLRHAMNVLRQKFNENER